LPRSFDIRGSGFGAARRVTKGVPDSSIVTAEECRGRAGSNLQRQLVSRKKSQQNQYLTDLLKFARRVP
jgi:hypothetical protein